MEHGYTLQLMADVEVREDAQDILLAGPSGAGLRLKRPSSAFRALLGHLARGGMDRSALCEVAMGATADGFGTNLARLYFALAEIERKGFVRYTVAQRGHALATLEPATRAFRLDPISGDGHFLLSRFACVRRQDDKMVVES